MVHPARCAKPTATSLPIKSFGVSVSFAENSDLKTIVEEMAAAVHDVATFDLALALALALASITPTILTVETVFHHHPRIPCAQILNRWLHIAYWKEVNGTKCPMHVSVSIEHNVTPSPLVVGIPSFADRRQVLLDSRSDQTI